MAVSGLKVAVLETMRRAWEVIVILTLTFSDQIFKTMTSVKTVSAMKPYRKGMGTVVEEAGYCLSWRMSVEANNMAGWPTVPKQCLMHIERYMLGGQYDRDVDFIVDQVLTYVKGIVLSQDAMDAWILDVDDTCISNLFFYKGKRFGYFFIFSLYYYYYYYIFSMLLKTC